MSSSNPGSPFQSRSLSSEHLPASQQTTGGFCQEKPVTSSFCSPSLPSGPLGPHLSLGAAGGRENNGVAFFKSDVYQKAYFIYQFY